MSITTPDASDVPAVFDVIINGRGYVTARAVDPNLPFRVQQQSLQYTPTFLERTNVSGKYGDDSQAFFLTSSQNDFSEGEQQKFFRAADADSVRRYWQATNVDVSIVGQATIRPAVTAASFATTPVSACDGNFAYAASATNLFTVTPSGVVDKGAHGLGATPSQFGMAFDGVNVFMTTTAAGTVGVRKYNGSVFSTFSASGADSLAFLNNTLYGYRAGAAANDLVVYDTGGVLTSVFPWKAADGTTVATAGRLRQFGGKLLALRQEAPTTLWIYDGVGASVIAQLPTNIGFGDLAVSSGIVFISGWLIDSGEPVIYSLANGQLGLLWKGVGIAGAPPALASFGSGLLFTDATRNVFMLWTAATGAITTVGGYSLTVLSAPVLASSRRGAVVIGGATACSIYNGEGAKASTATVTTSLIDFDNSLTKLLRGIKVDFSAATDGNGGSVDIAYQIDSLDGAYTTLQASAVSGTEYALSGISGHSISVKITLNKGTSTLGPTLKRVYVRGVPIMQAYRLNDYILDLGGSTSNPVRLRDGNSEHNLSGEQMRANLAAAITSQTPLQITDVTGSYTGILEPANCEFDTNRPAQYYARIRIREV